MEDRGNLEIDPADLRHTPNVAWTTAVHQHYFHVYQASVVALLTKVQDSSGFDPRLHERCRRLPSGIGKQTRRKIYPFAPNLARTPLFATKGTAAKLCEPCTSEFILHAMLFSSQNFLQSPTRGSGFAGRTS